MTNEKIKPTRASRAHNLSILRASVVMAFLGPWLTTKAQSAQRLHRAQRVDLTCGVQTVLCKWCLRWV